jgi:fumarylacetoacetase
MAPFRTAQPTRPEGDPAPLPYLLDAADQEHGALALTLEVHLATNAMRAAGMEPVRLSKGSATSMYWTVHQILAHHASGGCNLSPGDLLGTGTISSPDRGGFGSLLEISEGGNTPFALPNGETRTFLEDGDEVILTARAEAANFVPIGFGSCRAAILPAR